LGSGSVALPFFIAELDGTGIPRHKYKDNIKVDLKEIGNEDLDWSYLA
jgi:hypothetical protein